MRGPRLRLLDGPARGLLDGKAAGSVGTFPKLVNATAAAFSAGPKLIPFTNPPAGTAVVIFPQQAHLRCGSRNSVRHGTTLTSQI